MIVATDITGGYAKDGKIPWHIPEDLRHFKRLTDGNICIMGKTTYLDLVARLGNESESILPNRDCYVVSTTLTQEEVKGATVITSLSDLMVGKIADEDYDKRRKLFFIGGERIFREAIESYADTIHLTLINNDYECDRHIDMYNMFKLFSVVDEKILEIDPSVDLDQTTTVKCIILNRIRKR